MIKLPVLLLASALCLAADTFTGVITDSMCKMDHKSMNAGTDEECVRKCVQSDKRWKYILFDGQKSYILSDQQTPAQYAARKVRVTGKLYEKTGVIKVDRIEAVK